MANPQTGTVFRYFPLEADHDVSADQLEVSLDSGVTWLALQYVAVEDYPPSVVAANATPPDAGFTRYWWRALTGPNQPLPLERGIVVLLGRLADSPETPNFAWTFRVGHYE